MLGAEGGREHAFGMVGEPVELGGDGGLGEGFGMEIGWNAGGRVV